MTTSCQCQNTGINEGQLPRWLSSYQLLIRSVSQQIPVKHYQSRQKALSILEATSSIFSVLHPCFPVTWTALMIFKQIKYTTASPPQEVGLKGLLLLWQQSGSAALKIVLKPWQWLETHTCLAYRIHQVLNTVLQKEIIFYNSLLFFKRIFLSCSLIRCYEH